MMNHDDRCPDTAYPLCLERLSSIETKLDISIEKHGDIERRLRRLEWRDATIIGACAIISLGVPFILHFLKML